MWRGGPFLFLLVERRRTPRLTKPRTSCNVAGFSSPIVFLFGAGFIRNGFRIEPLATMIKLCQGPGKRGSSERPRSKKTTRE